MKLPKYLQDLVGLLKAPQKLPRRASMAARVEGRRCVKIPVGEKLWAVIDEKDAPRVSRLRWSPVRVEHLVYARRLLPGGRSQFMHRFILRARNRKPKIDHDNHNGLDNRRKNLRRASNNQNTQNSYKFRTPCSSRFKGVYQPKVTSRWYAMIKAKGRRIFLGSFKMEIEAAKAYDRAAIKYFGRFACINLKQRKEKYHVKANNNDAR